MFCEKCGNELPEGAKFCGSCGSKAEPQQPAMTTDAPVGSAPPPPYTPPVQTAPPHSQVYPPVQPISYPVQSASEPLSIGQYIGMFLLLCIPLLNIILLFVWSFGSSFNRNKKNFARAQLILFAIMLVFWIIAGGVIMSALSEITGSLY